MWAGKSNVLVAVRVRPMNSKEHGATRNVVKVVDDRMIVVMDRSDSGKKRQRQDVLRKHRSKEKRYAFDFAFGPETPTETVYNHTTRFLIDGVVIGYNATVFAYGATGAGKTHTMLGGAASATNVTESEAANLTNVPGIMVLTLQDLFAKIETNMKRANSQKSMPSARSPTTAPESEGPEEEEEDNENETKSAAEPVEGKCGTPSSGGPLGRSYRVTCSFLEVYNEMIRDLLTPSSEYLDLREDPVKGPTVTGLSEVEASSASDVMSLLRKGNARRTTEGTAANQASSRSHAVLQITVERRDNGLNANAVAVSNVTLGKLSLIDLAGSERASVTQNRGARLLEGANINRSLLALGNCINALREGGKGAFVPYRDSKLTRLLKDSLGGNCRTVMVAAVSPAKNQIEETLNTLKYANRAKNIKTQAERNVLNVDYHATEYVNLISRLKNEIASLRNQLKKPSFSHQLQAQQQQQPSRAQQQQAHGPQQGYYPPQHQHQQAQSGGIRGAGNASNKEVGARKAVEKQQMTFLREQLVLNFKERMQLCRSLIEIEAQNIANKSEMELHRVVIQRWEDSVQRKAAIRERRESLSDTREEKEEEVPIHPEEEAPVGGGGQDSEADDEGEDSAEETKRESRKQRKRRRARKKVLQDLSIVTEPPNVRSARIETQQLQRANQKNGQLKADIERRLSENEKASAALRTQMETRITSEERRELMELEYRIGMLELENMELERSRMLHRCSVQYKDMLIQRLLDQLQVRDDIIEEQRKLLEDNGVGESLVDGALEVHFSDLESLHMLQSLPTGAPMAPGTPTPRNMPRPASGSLRQRAPSHHQHALQYPFHAQRAQALAGQQHFVPHPGHQQQYAISHSPGYPGARVGLAAPLDRAHGVAGGGASGLARGSAYGLTSPVTGRQMFPLHRLEEELKRIELSNPYAPASANSARGRQAAADSGASVPRLGAASLGSARSHQSRASEGNISSRSRSRSNNEVAEGPPSQAPSGIRRPGRTKVTVGISGSLDRDRRPKASRRVVVASHQSGPYHVKRSHPYLRHSALAKKAEKTSRSKSKARNSTNASANTASVANLGAAGPPSSATASAPGQSGATNAGGAMPTQGSSANLATGPSAGAPSVSSADDPHEKTVAGMPPAGPGPYSSATGSGSKQRGRATHTMRSQQARARLKKTNTWLSRQHGAASSAAVQEPPASVGLSSEVLLSGAGSSRSLAPSSPTRSMRASKSEVQQLSGDMCDEDLARDTSKSETKYSHQPQQQQQQQQQPSQLGPQSQQEQQQQQPYYHHQGDRGLHPRNGRRHHRSLVQSHDEASSCHVSSAVAIGSSLDSCEEKRMGDHRPPSSPTRTTSSSLLSLPPIKLSQSVGAVGNTGPLRSPGSYREAAEFEGKTAVVAPAPPSVPHQQAVADERQSNPKNVLSRLNSKIASGMSLLNSGAGGQHAGDLGLYGHGDGSSLPSDNAGDAGAEDCANALDGDVGGEGSVVYEEPSSAREARRAEKREKKKLEKRWAELVFVLRKPVDSSKDFENIRSTAQRSLRFLDQLDRKAMELNVLRGTLSRMLLPYSEDTAAADQRANTPVTGDSPLDSVMDFETRRQMVASANDLRSLVRVKIADDADLDQARTAVSEVRVFFDKLEAFAEKKNCTAYEAFCSLRPR